MFVFAFYGAFFFGTVRGHEMQRRIPSYVKKTLNCRSEFTSSILLKRLDFGRQQILD